MKLLFGGRKLSFLEKIFSKSFNTFGLIYREIKSPSMRQAFIKLLFGGRKRS